MVDKTQTTYKIEASDIEMLDLVISAYYQKYLTGGSLHIVLDDGNWHRSDIEFCLSIAEEKHDYVGISIAKLLLLAPDVVLEEFGSVGWGIGMIKWKDYLGRNHE